MQAGGATSQDLGLGRTLGQVLVYLYLTDGECPLDRIEADLGLSKASVSIAKTGPGTKTKRERLESIAEHLVKNKHRLQYAKFRKQDLDIGSGPVEGAVRNVVRLRLDGPGMRWGRGRSELVLHLRCILLNGQWQQFSEYLASQAQIKLPARAAPTQPHDAKPKKAA